MSYQVNYRLFVCDCEYWEAEAIAKLQRELHDACIKVLQDNHFSKQIGLSSAEITFLNK